MIWAALAIFVLVACISVQQRRLRELGRDVDDLNTQLARLDYRVRHLQELDV